MTIIAVFNRNLSLWQLHCHYLEGVIQTSRLNIALNVSTFSESRKRKSSQSVCFNCHGLGVCGGFDIFCISTTKISMNVKNQVRGRVYYTPTWHNLQIKVWQKIFRDTWKTWRKTECKCRERRRGNEVVINLKNDSKIVTAAAACKKETDFKETENKRKSASTCTAEPSLFQKISKLK